MKNLGLKFACVFIIIMYCLAPLSALDLNQDDNNTKYINQKESSDIKVKDVNVTDVKNDEGTKKIDDVDVDDSKNLDDADASKKIDDADVDDNKNFSAPARADDKDKNLGKSSADEKKLEKRLSPELGIHVSDISKGDKLTVEVTAVKGFSGNVYVSIDGSLIIHKVHVENGKGSITLSKSLAIGKHSATVIYAGSLSYKADEKTTFFNVNKMNPNLSISVDDINVGEKATLKINGNEKFNGYVYVSVYGVIMPQKVYVKNGVATYRLKKDLCAGQYTACVFYDGDKAFKPSKYSTRFEVIEKEKANPNLSIRVDDITEGEKAVALISANETLSGDARVYLNGSNAVYPVAIANGEGSVTINDYLAPGEHIATVRFNGDDAFKAGENSTSFKVSEKPAELVDPNLSIRVDDIAEGEKAVALISANETLSGDARVYLDGSNAVYPVSIVDGSASVTIDEDLAPGDYVARVRFNGDDTFMPAENSTSFKVSETPDLVDPNLNIKVSDVTYGNKAVVSISTNETFSDNVGVDIGSKHYDVKVANGKGSVAVSGLAVGTHTAKATFKETDTFNASTKSTKFAVKKANVKITAKAKAFKYSQKTKNYSITLKDNKGKALKSKKVTSKVNGKTYSAKTNAKGVATFKITNLNKVGARNAAISYAGDKTFNKESKKVKITVRFDAISPGNQNKLMVKKIQRALKRNHFYLNFRGHNLLVDGLYHIYTKWAVRKYQDAKGLKVNGKVDYATARKLKII